MIDNFEEFATQFRLVGRTGHFDLMHPDEVQYSVHFCWGKGQYVNLSMDADWANYAPFQSWPGEELAEVIDEYERKMFIGVNLKPLKDFFGDADDWRYNLIEAVDLAWAVQSEPKLEQKAKDAASILENVRNYIKENQA